MPGSRPKKVPVVLQVDELECGSACLAMICRAHDIPATLADCRQHLALRPRGVNALSLSEAALKFGLRARVYSVKTRETVEKLSLPAIVHFDSNHFVVLEGWSPRWDKVFIVDPAGGRRKLDGSEFLRRHSGVALTFEASAAPPVISPRAPSPRAPRPRRRIVSRVLQVPGARRLAVQLLAATLFIHLLALAAPLTAAALVDSASTSGPAELVNVAGAGVTGLVLALIVLGYLRSRLLAFFGLRLGVLMGRSSFQEILALPSFSDPRAIDDVTQRLLGRIRRAVGHQAVSMIVDGSWVLVPLLVLLVLEPPFFGLVVAAGVLHPVLRLGSPASRRMPLRSGPASGTEPADRALHLLNGMTSDPAERAGIASWRASALAAVRAAALLSVLWVGTTMILQQKTSLGTVLASISLTAQFLWPLASLMSAGRRLGAIGLQILPPFSQ